VKNWVVVVADRIEGRYADGRRGEGEGAARRTNEHEGRVPL
jgi:hypothetical protein